MAKTVNEKNKAYALDKLADLTAAMSNIRHMDDEAPDYCGSDPAPLTKDEALKIWQLIWQIKGALS